ncbi:MAG: Rieske (2Fe-2S) protein [Bacilli bacterium]|nr:Rieske (2Fe-2S) protein [Bacilli bacterium]
MEYLATQLSTLTQKGKMRVVIQNRPILLTYVNGSVYAIRDKCPHMGATLSNGILANGIITCKDHGLPISVITGEVTDSNKADFLRVDEHSRSVRIYQTIIKDNNIYVKL